jgi:hypothetical protein
MISYTEQERRAEAKAVEEKKEAVREGLVPGQTIFVPRTIITKPTPGFLHVILSFSHIILSLLTIGSHHRSFVDCVVQTSWIQAIIYPCPSTSGGRSW